MKNNIIGTLLRYIGLGFFVNGLFTITQNGFNINSVKDVKNDNRNNHNSYCYSSSIICHMKLK